MALLNNPYAAPPPTNQLTIDQLIQMMGAPVTDPNGQQLQFGRINAPQESNILTQLQNLGGMFNPSRINARTNLQTGLTGLGGYKFVERPDGTVDIDYNQEGPLGERQVDAVNEERWNANAKGMLYSSFADEKVGKRLSNLNVDAQKTINSYFADINDIQAKQGNTYSDLTGQLIGLLGEDVRYAVQNYVPPDGPVSGLTPTPGAPQTSFIGQQGNLAEAFPRPTASAPAPVSRTPQVSYQQFVATHGGKSTRALSDAWKKRFAPWLL